MMLSRLIISCARLMHSRPVVGARRADAFYPGIGRPSIDPELMIRILIVGHVFAIRSERALCREVKVNLAYRWFCKLGIEDQSRTTRRSRAPATNASATDFRRVLSVLPARASRQVWSVAKASRSMPA